MIYSLVLKLKILMGLDDDELATIYLEMAQADLLEQTNRTELLPSMGMLLLDLAATYVVVGRNKGLSSRSEGSISVSYAMDVPESMKKRISNYRLLHGSQHA